MRSKMPEAIEFIDIGDRYEILTMKKCSQCNTKYPRIRQYFRPRKDSKDGFRDQCRKCWNDKQQIYQSSESYKQKMIELYKTDKYKESVKRYSEKRKDKIRKYNRNHKLNKNYGIEFWQYQIMFEQRNGLCDICKNTENDRSLSVDHNHTTNKIRGLLCKKCNFAIGLLGDDSSLALKAYEYLLKHEDDKK